MPTAAAANPGLILASASPRRRALLSALGLPFEVRVADIDERVLPEERAEEHALRLAEAKARKIAMGWRDERSGSPEAGAGPLIIGADTIVVLEDRILGKPVDAAQARDYLRRLSGRRHRVMTGLAVLDAATLACRRHLAVTGVWIRDLTGAEIEAYVASGDPMDKAGAYAIQHAGLRPVARLEGSEANVIGLPLGALARMLAAWPR